MMDKKRNNNLVALGRSVGSEADAVRRFGRTVQAMGLTGSAAVQDCLAFAGAAEMNRVGLRAIKAGDYRELESVVARAKGRLPVLEEAARRQVAGLAQARLRNLRLAELE